MNRARTHVKKNDVVVVISGNHKGSSGRILEVIRAKNHVLIEGVRLIKKHQRRSQEHPNGAILEREGPIHISNVKLLEAPAKGTKTAKPAKNAKSDKTAKAAKADKPARKPKAAKAPGDDAEG